MSRTDISEIFRHEKETAFENYTPKVDSPCKCRVYQRVRRRFFFQWFKKNFFEFSHFFCELCLVLSLCFFLLQFVIIESIITIVADNSRSEVICLIVNVVRSCLFYFTLVFSSFEQKVHFISHDGTALFHLSIYLHKTGEL
jgi:hypothetical protein